ncbi:MAG: nucleotide pyrophosphatase, partial [Xenococcus sp. (in: cyanobacteria)]
SQPDHPLYEHRPKNLFDQNPLLEVFEAADNAVGEILAAAPENAYLMVFSVHGSGNNTTDVPSMFLLGEFLYRFNFPGKAMIAPGKVGGPVPPPILKTKRKTWTGEIWQRKYDPNPVRGLLREYTPSKFHHYIDRFLGVAQNPDLASAQKLQQESDPFYWEPVSWYKPLWPKMKAFALPSFSEGYIRINLEGREPQGIVNISEYDALCEELTEELYALKNPRNGLSVVKKVMRTRQSANQRDPKLPGADLVIEWDDIPTDVIDSPKYGRIGPVPYRRTGSHRSRGFVMVQGNGITPGSTLAEGNVIDLPPTILELMDAPISSRFDGKSLLQTSVASLV